MSASLDISSLFCRVCLSGQKSALAILSKQLQDVLERITDIPVTAERSQVCSLCAALLRKCLRLRETVQRANHLLRNASDVQNNTLDCKELRLHSLSISTSNITSYPHSIENQPPVCIDTKDLEMDMEPTLLVTVKCEPAEYCEPSEVIVKLEPLPSPDCQEYKATQFLQVQLGDPTGGSDGSLSEFNSKKIQNTRLNVTHASELPGTSKCSTGQQSRKRTHNDEETSVKMKKEKSFKCTECEYTSNRSANLVRHLRQHTGEKPYKCNDCGYRCSELQTLKSHVHTHTGEKPYKCSECDYRCRQPSRLRLHLRKHTGEKPYQCNECKYRCSHKASFIRHMKRMHIEVYKCKECTYTCNSAAKLDTHLQIHISDKTFNCSECGLNFAALRNLKLHLKIHTGEKPFQCTDCSYRCATSDKLKKHFRKHTKEKQFKCTECDYTCIVVADLKNHMRTHTGEKNI